MEKRNISMITATIKGYTASVLAYDTENDTEKILDCTIATKAFAERDAIAFVEKIGLAFCDILDITENTAVKIGIDSTYFYAHAEKMSKRPSGAYISRNVTIYDVNITVYNPTAKKVEKTVIKIDTENENAIERKVKSYCRANNRRLLKIGDTNEYSKTLYVMPVDEFMKNGQILD